MSFNYFKKAKSAEWKQNVARLHRYEEEQIMPGESTSDDTWLYYAARVNTEAVFQLTLIAEAMSGIQGTLDKNGDHRTDWGYPDNPYLYILGYHLYLPQYWTNILRDWQHLVRERSAYADLNRCTIEWEKLHSSRLQIENGWRKLDEALGNGDSKECDVDTSQAWRAVKDLVLKLEKLDSSIYACLGDMTSAWKERKISVE